MIRLSLIAVASALLSGPCLAGVHYSGETWADLPTQWRGFLVDQRNLRSLANSNPAMPSSPLKEKYQNERDHLLNLKRPLSADESADLGALHVRLGAVEKAIEVLRKGLREAPEHFRCASNLGTACQLNGDMDQAAAALELAVKTAPARWRKAEELQLRLVRLRRGEAKQNGQLDQLFGVKFAEEPTLPENLPNDSVSVTQSLALWLPADGRLLWQLGELAFAHGDVNTGASILEGCVTEFAMSEPELRRRRQLFRTIADKQAKAPPLPKSDAASVHEGHGSGSKIRFKSPRPLVRDPLQMSLNPISNDGINQLPWPLLAETTFERPFRVHFHEHLRKLNGKRIVLTGFIQPTGDDFEQSVVLLMEFPVGCWFCETPEVTGIIQVEASSEKLIKITRDQVRVEGKLRINSKDPESYLYVVTDARVGPVD